MERLRLTGLQYSVLIFVAQTGFEQQKDHKYPHRLF